MSTLSLFSAYDLTQSQIWTATALFSAIWITIGMLAKVVYAADKKKMAWIISLCNSFVLTVLGAVYLYYKIPQYEQPFFLFGDNGKAAFHSIDNFSFLTCLWFGLANTFDLLFGVLFYPKYLDPLTAWVHHTVYIWMLVICCTGNGGFTTATPFATGMVFNFVEELPTLLLALGSVFPSCRTDLGFGVTFLVLRLIYHLYMAIYAVFVGVETVILILYFLTSTLHIFWFATWVRKYGVKLFKKDGDKKKQN